MLIFSYVLIAFWNDCQSLDVIMLSRSEMVVTDTSRNLMIFIGKKWADWVNLSTITQLMPNSTLITTSFVLRLREFHPSMQCFLSISSSFDAFKAGRGWWECGGLASRVDEYVIDENNEKDD